MCLAPNKSPGNLVCGVKSTADKIKEGTSLRAFEYEVKEAEEKSEGRSERYYHLLELRKVVGHHGSQTVPGIPDSFSPRTLTS
ncbi:hypothetical protein CF326_g3555, partial [Tilletia indica]